MQEFNFHTDKRAQHNPPIELFNKVKFRYVMMLNSIGRKIGQQIFTVTIDTSLWTWFS